MVFQKKMLQLKIVWSEGGQIMVKSIFEKIDFFRLYKGYLKK